MEICGEKLPEVTTGKNAVKEQAKRQEAKVKMMAEAEKAWPDFKLFNNKNAHIVCYEEGKATGKILAFNKDRAKYLREWLS